MRLTNKRGQWLLLSGCFLFSLTACRKAEVAPVSEAFIAAYLQTWEQLAPLSDATSLGPLHKDRFVLQTQLVIPRVREDLRAACSQPAAAQQSCLAFGAALDHYTQAAQFWKTAKGGLLVKQRLNAAEASLEEAKTAFDTESGKSLQLLLDAEEVKQLEAEAQAARAESAKTGKKKGPTGGGGGGH